MQTDQNPHAQISKGLTPGNPGFSEERTNICSFAKFGEGVFPESRTYVWRGIKRKRGGTLGVRGSVLCGQSVGHMTEGEVVTVKHTQ